jgi:hypothetical protein
MRRWVLWAALALPMVLAGCSGSSGLDSRTGVSRSPSGEAQLHYALCEGERMTMIRAEELVGGSRTGYGVPIYWQIESDGAEISDPVIVGSVPGGWTETVHYRGTLPDDELIGIEGTRDRLGMSFRPAALREGEVLRGTYDTVSLEQFQSDADDECEATKRGALIAGLLAPLVTVAALLLVWRLHRAQPDTWGGRQARRGWIWVVTLCAGTYWTLMLFAVERYQAHIGEIAVFAVLAAIPAALSGLVVVPVAVGLGSLGRRVVPAGSRSWAAAGAAIGCGAVFWVTTCGLDWRWFPVSVAVALGLVAMVPASQPGLRVPPGRSARIAVMLALSVCCLASALAAVGMLSNSPSKPAWNLADYQPSERVDAPVAPASRVLLDDRRSGSDELSFDASPGYELSVACGDVSIQVSAGLSRGPVSYGAREVVPCRAGGIDGPLGDRVRAGEQLFLKVVAPSDVEWHIVATAGE